MKIEVVSALPHSTVHSAVLSRRHRSIICAGPYEILPLETCFEPLPSTSTLSEFPIECLQLSMDERSIGVATNSLLKVADITTGREVRNLTGHILPITSLAASKFSPYCWYSGSSDSTWTQWDTRMHPSTIYGSKTSGVVRSVALSPGDRYIAIGTDESIQLFDARQREYIKTFNCSGHNLEFHPAECLLSAVGHDRIVRFFCLSALEMISQSDPFLDDIQASVFDTHVMIAATNDSINLLSWEPSCEVVSTALLKNVDKVVNVSVNGDNMDLNLICIGQNTERLEMRSYPIEELLVCPPGHELCGSIYEEDEDVDTANNSPIEETKPLPEMPSSPIPSSEESTETSPSPVNSSGSSHSSPSSPAKPASVKQRSTSQKSPKSTTSSSKTAPSLGVKLPTRSVTPVTTKPPVTRSMAAGQSRSATLPQKPIHGGFRPKPSPSMSDLRTAKASSIAGSTQSLISERGPKTRSVSRQRNNQEISITYMGRPRTPSEGDAVSSSTTTTNGTISRRRPSPAVKKTSPSSMTSSSPAKKSPARAHSAAPVKKQNSTSSSVTSTSSTTSSAHFGAWGQCIETVNRIGHTAKKENKNIRRLKMITGRRTMNEVAPEVSSDEHLVMTASRILSRNNEWSLNTCHAYLPTLVDNITSMDKTVRTAALEGLAAIASTFRERLTKFANSHSHRIGVDVAAEERAEKAKACIQRLREMVKKRDVYYKQLDEDSIDKLDKILEQLKTI